MLTAAKQQCSDGLSTDSPRPPGRVLKRLCVQKYCVGISQHPALQCTVHARACRPRPTPRDNPPRRPRSAARSPSAGHLVTAMQHLARPVIRAIRDTIGIVAAGTPKNGTNTESRSSEIHVRQVIERQPLPDSTYDRAHVDALARQQHRIAEASARAQQPFDPRPGSSAWSRSRHRAPAYWRAHRPHRDRRSAARCTITGRFAGSNRRCSPSTLM